MGHRKAYVNVHTYIDVPATASSTLSPCINLCRLIPFPYNDSGVGGSGAGGSSSNEDATVHHETGQGPIYQVCVGCGRSIKEIRDWRTYTADKIEQVLAQASLRKTIIHNNIVS